MASNFMTRASLSDRVIAFPSPDTHVDLKVTGEREREREENIV
jgi:hypothetical protein